MRRLPPAEGRCAGTVPDGCPLTNTEFYVLSLLAKGLSTAEIVRTTGRARSTISHQCHTACKRLGVHSRLEAIVVMKDSGWLGAMPRRANVQDPPLSHGQMLYLKAFDLLLRDRSREAEAAVTICFAAMCWEAGARPKRRCAGVDGWLLSMAQRLTDRRPMAVAA